MREEAFRAWLLNTPRNGSGRVLDARTVGSRLSNCRTVEQYEGGLDDLFEQDQLRGLIERLTYSTDDERQNRPARHRIPIDGNIRNGTATLRSAVSLYRQFRENWVEGTPILPATLNRARLPAISRVARSPEKREWPTWDQPDPSMPINSNHELIRRGLSLLTKGLRPFVEKEMRTVYGEDWEHEARSALSTPPDVLLHWDSQAVLNVIDRRWNEVFRRKLERKHRSWAIEAVALRHDLMHEKKQMFSDKETIRGLDTVECLLAAVSASESQEVALLKNSIGDGPPTPHADGKFREFAARIPVGQPPSGIEGQFKYLPIYLVPSDPVIFKQQLLRSRVAEIVTTYSDGKVETKVWRAANFSASSNVIGNLRSRPEFRQGQWQAKGIAKVTVRVLENA